MHPGAQFRLQHVTKLRQLKLLHRSKTVFESVKDENKCCGWTNVFDYCSSIAVLEIAVCAMHYHEMMKIYYDLNNPENSVDYGIDSSYDLDYIDEEYDIRRRRSMTSWEIRSSLRKVFDHFQKLKKLKVLQNERT